MRRTMCAWTALVALTLCPVGGSAQTQNYGRIWFVEAGAAALHKRSQFAEPGFSETGSFGRAGVGYPLRRLSAFRLMGAGALGSAFGGFAVVEGALEVAPLRDTRVRPVLGMTGGFLFEEEGMGRIVGGYAGVVMPLNADFALRVVGGRTYHGYGWPGYVTLGLMNRPAA